MLQTIHPLRFKELFWPDVYFYDKQREILQSLVDNDETVVKAGNGLGKDFTAGFAVLWYFMTRQPCRIITTSVKEDHLRVLWGEINNFIQSAKHPLKMESGGPLKVRHLEINRMMGQDLSEQSPKCYIRGMVAKDGAALQGHWLPWHPQGVRIPTTMAVIDEASGIPDEYYRMLKTWAHRVFIFGNPWPCSTYFYMSFAGNPAANDPGGDTPRSNNAKGLYRENLTIKSEDSPNVKYAQAVIASGKEYDGTIIVPGVKDFDSYTRDRKMLDAFAQSVTLDAEFYEGSEIKMFPPLWIKRAEDIAKSLTARKIKRKAKAMGIDPAEGGDKSAWAIVDEFGLIELISKQTPDTSTIPNETIHLITKYGLEPRNVCIDAGGGGKQHADALRSRGYNIRTVPFGESASVIQPEAITTGSNKEHRDDREERYAYTSRRIEMYHLLRQMIDPVKELGFGLPAGYVEIRRQLQPIPYWYDDNGRLCIPRKHGGSKEHPSLVDLIGHSPDEVEALILAVFGLTYPDKPFVIKPMFQSARN